MHGKEEVRGMLLLNGTHERIRRCGSVAEEGDGRILVD